MFQFGGSWSFVWGGSALPGVSGRVTGLS